MTDQLGLGLVEPVIQRFDLTPLAGAERAAILAIDCETETRHTGHGPKRDFGLSYSAPITTISFAWKEGSEIKTGSLYASDGIWPQTISDWLIARFDRSVCVFHNAVFDIRQLSKITHSVIPHDVYCTMTIERILAPATDKSYSLVNVARAHGLAVPEQQAAMKAARGKLHTQKLDDVLRYAESDALLTYQVYEKQVALTCTTELYALVDWECRALHAYAQMAAQGVRLNKPGIQARMLELGALVQDAASRLKADGLDNPASPAGRVKYLYEIKKLPRPTKDDPDRAILFTNGGMLSASADAIMLIADRSPEHTLALGDLIIWIDCDRMLATLTSLLEHADLDGRIHSLISISTETGRRVSQHPNIQNWKMAAQSADDPAGTLCGVAIGDDDDSTLVEIDYSNAENWMAAMLAGDDHLAAACSADDFHSAMAEKYFGDKWQQADKDERKRMRKYGKFITFGSAYGAGSKKIAAMIGCGVDEAGELLRAKDRAFPDVAETKLAAAHKAENQGYINLWTRRRVPVDKERSYTAWNFLCQGGVAEMLKRAIVEISEAYEKAALKSRICIDIHDAIVISVSHDEWDQAIGIAEQAMSNVIPQEFNSRTTPPIQWIAKFDPAENAKKWGKGQVHPSISNFEIVEPLTPPAPPVPPVPAQNEPQQALSFSLAGLGWSDTLTASVAYSEAGMVQAVREVDPNKLRTFLLGLWEGIEKAYARTFEVALPVVANGEIKTGQSVKVDWTNFQKVMTAWQSLSAKCDVPALVGAEILAQYKLLTEGLTPIIDRVAQMLESLSVLEGGAA